MFHEILDKGYTPAMITYNAFINGLCKEGRLQQALGMLDVLVQTGHQPNEITYNTLINGICKVGNLEKAKELLQEMLEKDCRPDIVPIMH
jgi:pentatricopeptide repeat protein